MSLTPEDVERKVFKQEFRGYSQAEVDTFLDLVTERLGELGRERDLLLTRLRDAEHHANERVARVEAYAEERIAEIEKRASEAIETEQHLKRALVTAERAAHETLQSAQAKAGEALEQANAQADHTLTEARSEAEQTLTEARREADQILGDAHRQAAAMLVDVRKRIAEAKETCRSEVDRIQRTVAAFTTLRDEYRDRVRGVVEEYLAWFDKAGELPDVPAQLIEFTKVSKPNWTDMSDTTIIDSSGETSEMLVDTEPHNGDSAAGGPRGSVQTIR
ncbi:MAG: DivIVA domain-containing protein [Egibacteraceae bacterium]